MIPASLFKKRKKRMYSKTTNDIKVTVSPQYLEEQSTPEDNHFVWAYHIVIQNNGAEPIQLRTRYWKITDSNGLTNEVSGKGVVGDQPTIEPGESYEYSSGAPLHTPGGFMVGTYTMSSVSGEQFTVEIPAFSLDSPYQSSVLN